MRLAIVWRSRDIFSVVPRNVLAALPRALPLRGLGRGLRWGSGGLLGSLSLLASRSRRRPVRPACGSGHLPRSR